MSDHNPFDQLKTALPLLSKREATELADLLSERLDELGVTQTELQKQTGSTRYKQHKSGGGKKKIPFWLKHVTEFDKSQMNGYSFKGEFIYPNKLDTLHDRELILFGKGKGDDACFALLEKEGGVTTDVFGFTVDHARVITTSEASRFMPNEYQRLHGKPIAPVWKEALERFHGS